MTCVWSELRIKKMSLYFVYLVSQHLYQGSFLLNNFGLHPNSSPEYPSDHVVLLPVERWLLHPVVGLTIPEACWLNPSHSDQPALPVPQLAVVWPSELECGASSLCWSSLFIVWASSLPVSPSSCIRPICISPEESSFTRGRFVIFLAELANRSVECVSSREAGVTVHTITVFEFPPREFWSILVSLLFR